MYKRQGLKYNVPRFNTTNEIVHEVVNAEAAIKRLNGSVAQNEAKVFINNKLNNAINSNKCKSQNNFLKSKYKQDIMNLKTIKSKLEKNDAIISKADKGDTLVVMQKRDYTQKVFDFINNNNIKKIDRDPTKAYVKTLNNTINQCKFLLDEKTRRYLKPINATAPKFTGLPKIHKESTPVSYTHLDVYKRQVHKHVK